MSDDPYVYAGTTVLRNKLAIRSAKKFEYNERELVLQRIVEGTPSGNFDLAHLKAIHRHLFQDVFDWAGEIRTIEIAKGAQQFQFCKYIGAGMADVHRRLVVADCLRGLDRKAFAAQAGHPVDLTRLDPQRWLAASQRAHAGDYVPMAEEIARACAGR